MICTHKNRPPNPERKQKYRRSCAHEMVHAVDGECDWRIRRVRSFLYASDACECFLIRKCWCVWCVIMLEWVEFYNSFTSSRYNTPNKHTHTQTFTFTHNGLQAVVIRHRRALGLLVNEGIAVKRPDSRQTTQRLSTPASELHAKRIRPYTSERARWKGTKTNEHESKRIKWSVFRNDCARA